MLQKPEPVLAVQVVMIPSGKQMTFFCIASFRDERAGQGGGGGIEGEDAKLSRYENNNNNNMK